MYVIVFLGIFFVIHIILKLGCSYWCLKQKCQIEKKQWIFISFISLTTDFKHKEYSIYPSLCQINGSVLCSCYEFHLFISYIKVRPFLLMFMHKCLLEK